MDSTTDSPQADGPRHATLLDQMQAWYVRQLASHQPPTSPQRRVPPAMKEAP